MHIKGKGGSHLTDVQQYHPTEHLTVVDGGNLHFFLNLNGNCLLWAPLAWRTVSEPCWVSNFRENCHKLRWYRLSTAGHSDSSPFSRFQLLRHSMRLLKFGIESPTIHIHELKRAIIFRMTYSCMVIWSSSIRGITCSWRKEINFRRKTFILEINEEITKSIIASQATVSSLLSGRINKYTD